MATAAQQQLYPLSTEDSKSIPLDVALPLTLIKDSVVHNAATVINLPADFNIVGIYSTVPCIIDFTNTATFPVPANIELDSAVFIPQDSYMVIKVPSTGLVKVCPLISAGTGIIMINNLQKWAGLGLDRNLRTR